jgi:hypothetical protein
MEVMDPPLIRVEKHWGAKRIWDRDHPISRGLIMVIPSRTIWMKIFPLLMVGTVVKPHGEGCSVEASSSRNHRGV